MLGNKPATHMVTTLKGRHDLGGAFPVNGLVPSDENSAEAFTDAHALGVTTLFGNPTRVCIWDGAPE